MQAFKDFIKNLFFFIDGLVLLKPFKNKKRVALIKTNEIGDFIIWLASAKHFREIYPNKEIVLIGNQSWSELLKHYDVCDHFIGLDVWRFRLNIFYRLKTLWRIRTLGAELIVNLLYSKDLFLSDAIVRCSGAKERIGIKGDNSNYERLRDREKGEKFYTQLLDIDIKQLHELEINRKIQQSLSGEQSALTYPKLNYHKLQSEDEYYILFPGANTKNRQWPIENFAQIAKWIYSQTGMTGVICGIKSERYLAERLIDLSDIPLLDLTGKTSLEQFVDKIGNAQLVISNDTSAVHIASATNTPSVAILGGGHFGRFLPYVSLPEHNHSIPLVVNHEMDCYGCKWDCQFVGFNQLVPCIEKVSCEQVINQLKMIFAQIDIGNQARD